MRSPILIGGDPHSQKGPGGLRVEQRLYRLLLALAASLLFLLFINSISHTETASGVRLGGQHQSTFHVVPVAPADTATSSTTQSPSASATATLTLSPTRTSTAVQASATRTETVQASPTSTPVECGVGHWSSVLGVDVGNSTLLYSVAAVSASDAWAVGYYTGQDGIFRTFTEYWDGTRWRVIPSPNPETGGGLLYGVSAAGPNDVWAVGMGHYGVHRPLSMHWDGTQWTIVQMPTGTASTLVRAVTVISTNDVWAAGYSCCNSETNDDNPIVWHWDGTGWQINVLPTLEYAPFGDLNSISATSSTDVWTVGNRTSNGYGTLTYHWNGAYWSQVASPTVGSGYNQLNAVVALSPSNAWAAGYYDSGGGGVQRGLILHWDGTQWGSVASPSVGAENRLWSMSATSASDIWAVGDYIEPTQGLLRTLVEHWDGTRWTVLSSVDGSTENNQLLSVSALAPLDMWSVGTQTFSNVNRLLIEHYQPGHFTDEDPDRLFYQWIECLACRGIVTGYADGSFGPINPVTRSQISKIMSNAAGYNDDPGSQVFEDIQPGSPFYTYTNRLANRQIMSGYPCGGPGEPCGPNSLPYFRPGNNASRGQVSKIVSNTAGFEDQHTEQNFEDVPTSSPFYIWIERLASRSVIGGYQCGRLIGPCIPPDNRPYFRPNDIVTRGQSAKITSATLLPGCSTP